MGEPYGFWAPVGGPDPYPGDALIDAANEAIDLRRENERLRAVVDWVRQYQLECEAPAGAKDPMLRAAIRQSMFDAAAEVEEGSA